MPCALLTVHGYSLGIASLPPVTLLSTPPLATPHKGPFFSPEARHRDIQNRVNITKFITSIAFSHELSPGQMSSVYTKSILNQLNLLLVVVNGRCAKFVRVISRLTEKKGSTNDDGGMGADAEQCTHKINTESADLTFGRRQWSLCQSISLRF